MAKAKFKDTNLAKIIQDDTKLSVEEKHEFLSLATIFSANFMENLTKSSVQLAEESGLDLATWRKFLMYPSIRRMIDSIINEQIRKKADTALLSGAGTRDAINVRKAMLDADSGEDNTRYILMRLPEKTDDIHE